MQHTTTSAHVGHDHAIACDGNGGALGHPKVYLDLQNGRAVCPYCGRVFTAQASENAEGAA